MMRMGLLFFRRWRCTRLRRRRSSLGSSSGLLGGFLYDLGSGGGNLRNRLFWISDELVVSRELDIFRVERIVDLGQRSDINLDRIDDVLRGAFHCERIQQVQQDAALVLDGGR